MEYNAPYHRKSVILGHLAFESLAPTKMKAMMMTRETRPPNIIGEVWRKNQFHECQLNPFHSNILVPRASKRMNKP